MLPLLLTKDVRSWTTSVQKKHGGSSIKRYVRWYIEAKKFTNFLKDYTHLKVGYEEFALFPEKILQMVCKNLRVEFDEKMLIPSNSKGHSVFSNRMRYDKNKMSKIFYDYRWFQNNSLNIASSLMPFVMKLNNELVYSNVKV